MHRRRCDRRAIPDVTVTGRVVTMTCPDCGARTETTETPDPTWPGETRKGETAP